MTNNNDLDGDGKISDVEIQFVERRTRTQRRLAILSFIANTILAGVIVVCVLVGILTPAMATSLGTLLPMYWVGSWGIIAAYMGVEAFLNKR